MNKKNSVLTPELKAALLLHVNQRLFDQGLIPKWVYDEAKIEIVKRSGTTT